MGRSRSSSAEPERLTIRLDPTWAERLRVLAARQRRSMSDLAEEALSLYLPQAERALKTPGRKASAEDLSSQVHGPEALEIWTPASVKRELVLLDATQTELAAFLGIRPSSLSLWLKQRGIPFARQRDLTVAIRKLRRSKRSR